MRFGLFSSLSATPFDNANVSRITINRRGGHRKRNRTTPCFLHVYERGNRARVLSAYSRLSWSVNCEVGVNACALAATMRGSRWGNARYILLDWRIVDFMRAGLINNKWWDNRITELSGRVTCAVFRNIVHSMQDVRAIFGMLYVKFRNITYASSILEAWRFNATVPLATFPH